MALLTIKVTDEEKEKMKQIAGDKPVGTYIKDIVLGGNEAGSSFAGENDEELASKDAKWLKETYGNLSKFLDVLFNRIGVRSHEKFEAWLKNEQSTVVRIPGFNWKLVDVFQLNGDNIIRARNIETNEEKELHPDHVEYRWFCNENDEWLYFPGEVIGQVDTLLQRAENSQADEASKYYYHPNDIEQNK